MRIAQVMASGGGDIDGLEKHVLTLCAGLAARHDVHLLADATYQGICPEDVHSHYVDFAKSRLNPVLCWQLGKELNAIQPDIIHAQAGKAVSLVRRLRWFFPRTPCVATVHGTKKISAPMRP